MASAGAALRLLGHESTHGRDVYSLRVAHARDFPEALVVGCPRFVLLLAADFSAEMNRVDLANRIIHAGCVFFCTWGSDCEDMHDIFDGCELDQNLATGMEADGVIMTTWHSRDSLADATEFALLSTWPDDYYAEGCNVVVLAAIGNESWALEMEQTSAEFLDKPSA